MGSSYSDLKIYLLRKTGAHGDGKYDFKTTKKFTDPCTNFEVVTHEIKPTNQPKKPHVYNVLLYDGENKDKPGKYVFGYYPSNENEMLNQVNVYFSIFRPENPFIITFYTIGTQTYNCFYRDLKSAGWDYASNITRYNFSDPLNKDKLLELYRSQSLNWKIQLRTDKTENVDISGYKEEIYTGENYRIIFVPKGKASVLYSECLFNLDKTEKDFKCNENNKSNQSNGSSTTPSQASSTKAINQIDPYYLTSVKDHFFDGIIVYFYNNKQNSTNSSQSSTSGSNGAASNSGTSTPSGGSNCKHDMALLLEFIDYCNTKTQIKRIDKNGYCWSEEEVKYKDDKSLEEALKTIKESSCENESITFILEKKNEYKGVSKVVTDKEKKTYSKYTHQGSPSNKPNIIFRRQIVEKIDNYDTKSVKTTTLDVYFLKIDNKEDYWPFIVMFNNEPTTNLENGAQPQAPQQSPNGTKAPTKRCFYFDLTNEFGKWHELKVNEKEAKEKPEEDQDKKLESKLTEKLNKIETNGSCQTDLYLLRSIAFYILDNDDVKEEEIKKKLDQRPPLQPTFVQPGMGRTLPFILGSVFGGVFAIGTLSAIIYGIYWYNTTIKLLT